MIKPLPVYRRDAFEKGLKKTGYKLVERGRPSGPADLLVMWNRQGAAESTANTWEACGGTVIVCENGYLGRDSEARQFYAIAAHGHNGSGWFPVGDEDRFAKLGIGLEPWRDGGYDLVCGQRGIGSTEMRSPTGWHARTSTRLQAMRRKVKVRLHPGHAPKSVPLETDLAGAGVCVVWSSTAGILALIKGVPVAYFAPHWIASAAASRGYAGVASPVKDDAARLAGLRHAAWGQRSVAEIESGEPFVSIRERLPEAKWAA
jgi:hypothetical protein